MTYMTDRHVILLVVVLTAACACGVAAETVSFRNGVDSYNGTEDSYLHRGKLEYNFGASDYMIMQGEGIGSYAQGLMKFDISDIPDDVTITSATLRIYLYNDIISGDTTRRGVRAYPMLVSVIYGNKDNAAASVGEVDAHQRAQAQMDWGLPNSQDRGPQPGVEGVGADVDISISGAASYYLSDIGSFLEIDVTDILDNWYAGTVTNHGFLLLGDTSQTAGYFRSSEHATIGERPELVIEYTFGPKCGDPLYGHPVGDFNEDCYVNLKDIVLFAQYWLDCTDPYPPCNFVVSP